MLFSPRVLFVEPTGHCASHLIHFMRLLSSLAAHELCDDRTAASEDADALNEHQLN